MVIKRSSAKEKVKVSQEAGKERERTLLALDVMFHLSLSHHHRSFPNLLKQMPHQSVCVIVYSSFLIILLYKSFSFSSLQRPPMPVQQTEDNFTVAWLFCILLLSMMMMMMIVFGVVFATFTIVCPH